MKKFTFPLVLSLLLIPAISSAQILKEMKDELKNTVSGSSDARSGGGGGGDAYFWADFILNVAYYPTLGMLFGFPDEPRFDEIDFSKFPYEDGRNGLYRPFGEEGFRMRGQFITHFQNNEDALSGAFFQLKFSPTRFLTLDVNHLQLFEVREGETDKLGITNFALEYNRIRLPRIHIWWGGGLMVLEGDQNYGSPSVVAGTTIFIKKPLSFYADVQAGWPNAVPAQQFQVRMQIHVKRYLFYGGYQGLKIGRKHQASWTMGTGFYF